MHRRLSYPWRTPSPYQLSSCAPRLWRSPVPRPPSQDPSFFFRHTTGRWLDNEASELKRLCLPFNVAALKTAAVSAVSVEGATSVVQMTKLPEGSYSKAFRMVLDNQKEVIARLPTSNVGPTHYVTASEVATMEFACTRLGWPVPQVLAWSSKNESNPVGSAFIIMEKAPGIEVDKVWHKLSNVQKLDLVKAIVKLETAALEYPLPGYGSIFFRDDVEHQMNVIPVDNTFVLGLSMDRKVWGAERALMDIDRGPWRNPIEYLTALSRREEEWIRIYASKQAAHPTLFHPAVSGDPSAHLTALELFNSVIPYIIPTDDPELIQPTLWHHDLSGSNIFISEDELAMGRIVITSVIDWQNTSVAPLYLQARVPRVFAYRTPWEVPPGLNAAELPENVEEMSESEQEAAKEDVFAKNREIYYRTLTKIHFPPYYHALTDSKTRLFAALALSASSLWGHMFHILRVYLANLQRAWPQTTAEPCPLHITEAEERLWREEGKEWQDRTDDIGLLCDNIGMDTNGWVSAREFKGTYRRYKMMKHYWLTHGATEEDWPFTGPARRRAFQGRSS